LLTRIYRNVGGNAKTLILTEPLWSIPMSWIFFYRPMFMSVVIGLLPVEIGILITIFNLLTSVMPLLGGYLADRFGRKRVFMLFDSVCWLTSLIIWAISYNIWHALLAYVIEGCASVIYSVWECLLVEDTMWEFRSLIYGSISAIWTIGSLTTPIAGYIIGLYGLDMGCRLLFLLAFCALVPAYIIRQIYLREPEIGRRVREDGSFSGVKGYLNSLSLMRRSRTILTLLTIIVMAGFFNSSYAYFSLYLIHREGLELSENVASLIPSVSSIVSLTLSLMVVPRLKSSGDYFKTLISGYSLGSLAIFLLINSPKGLLSTALLSGALLGFYSTVAFSVSRAFLANQIDAIDERARAKILSVTITLSSLINLPTPTIVGYLFSLNPKIPFIIILATFLTSLLTLICSLRNQNIR
jgi:DHA1 family tetracycline resistance protein-like MFS transporter